MDTPDRGRIPAPAAAPAAPAATGGGPSKAEDSPFFNFVNSLSPIPPVKPVSTIHSVQLFKQSDFTAISSIFTSPHVRTQKELKICTRSACADSSAGEYGSAPGPVNRIRVSKCKSFPSANGSVACLEDSPAASHKDSSNLHSDISVSVDIDPGSPEHNTKSGKIIPECLSSFKDFCQDESVYHDNNWTIKRKNLFHSRINLQEKHSSSLLKDAVIKQHLDYNISGNADGVAFNCCTDDEATLVANATAGFSDRRMYEQADIEKLHNQEIHSVIPIAQNSISAPEVSCTGEAEDSGASCAFQTHSNDCQHVEQNHHIHNMVDGADNQLEGASENNHHQRCIRRRCLTFDVGRSGDMSLYTRSESGVQSFNHSMTDCKSFLNSRSMQCALPGIGLHLNSVGTMSQAKIASYDAPATSIEHFNVPTSSPEAPLAEYTNQINSAAAGNELVLYEGDIECHDDEPLLLTAEDLSQESPKKKRRKVENAGEGDSCKRCSCKKSKCLKLYCECFAAGVYCSEPCSCQGCLNKPVHEETVLATRKLIESRNPLAFKPKVVRTSSCSQEIGEDANNTPASARHKRGCNCKKSNCLKKYCECFQSGVGCSAGCRCDGCKNTFGRREGIFPLIAEATEHDVEDKNAHPKEDKVEVFHDDGHTQPVEPLCGETLPITPSVDSCRSLGKPQFSAAKPPRSSAATVGYPSGLYSCQFTSKSEMMFTPLESYSDMVLDDTPDILNEDVLACALVKSSSPNSKRVSPPHSKAGLSSICKSGRKLILKSIPSFPSLSDVHNELPPNIHTAQ